MRLYALKDAEDLQGETLALLSYYEGCREFYFDMPEDADPWCVPLVLSSFAERKQWEVGPRWAGAWVRSRLVPESRQNLGEVLRENGLELYDEAALLEITEGKCIQDECYLVPIDVAAAPAWFAERESRRVLEAVPLSGNRLFVAFRNARTGVVDANAIDATESFSAASVADARLFYKAEVDTGGRGVRWGTRYRVSAQTLYDAAVWTSFVWGDIEKIAASSLTDASEAASTLGCSRQNVAALARRGSLKAAKSGQKYTLFMRADVRERLW